MRLLFASFAAVSGWMAFFFNAIKGETMVAADFCALTNLFILLVGILWAIEKEVGPTKENEEP